MSKYLTVGDSHVDKPSLPEGKALFRLVVEKAKQNQVDTVICLGDDIDNFSRPAVEVQHFFYDLINDNKDIRWIFILGNHSMPHHAPDTSEHSLLPLKSLSNAIVVDTYLNIDGMDFLPYCSNDQFKLWLKNCKSDYLFGHFTVDGAAYDNGFLAKEGLEQDLFKDKIAISGHIHSTSRIGNVYYPGSPRWLTVTAANQSKGINIWDKESNSFEFISTYPICKQIKKVEITEGSELPNLEQLNTRHLLQVTGTKAFCKKMDELYKGQAEIRTFVQDKVERKVVSESKGVINSLESFIKEDYPLQYTTDREKLWLEIQKRLTSE